MLPTITTAQPKPRLDHTARLTWLAAFSLGLITGWIVLGRVLLPASPTDAAPPQLAVSYQKLYLRLLADAYWWTQDTALVRQALDTWDRQAVSVRLAQMEAETAGGEIRTRLASLGATLDVPAPSLTLPDFIHRHSTILIAATLPLLMFLSAGGVSLAPYIRDLWRAVREPASDADLRTLPPAAQRLETLPGTRAGDTRTGVEERNAEVTEHAIDRQARNERSAAAQIVPLRTPSPQIANVFGPGTLGEDRAQPGQPPSPNPTQPPAGPGQPTGPNAHTTGEVATDEQTKASTSQPGGSPAVPGHTAPRTQSPVSAVEAALNDSSLPGDLEALLDDDIFSTIFDVDVLFDPFLKSLSSSLQDVEPPDLLRRARLVALSLYAIPLTRRDRNGDL